MQEDGHEDGLTGHHCDPQQLVRRHQVFEAQLQLGLRLRPAAAAVRRGGGGDGSTAPPSVMIRQHRIPSACDGTKNEILI
jgi:hypothetical protein